MPATKQDTVLIQAAKTGNIIHVQALLAKGVNANAKDSEGTTALMFAAQKGYTEIVRILLNNDANVNLASRRFGLTALMLAAAHKQPDSARLLLAAGADVNAKNDDGSTALMVASLKGDINVVRLLLDANADVNVRDKDGDSALKIAALSGHQAVVKALADAGAVADNSMLFLAVRQGRAEIVRILLKCGADANVKNLESKTALMQAADGGKFGCCRGAVGCWC